MMERLPFFASTAGEPYDALRRIPVVVVLDNVRSMYNVGSFFRTGDAAGIEKLILAGITAKPPKREITKTALGAEEHVPWEHTWNAAPAVAALHGLGYEIAAVETSPQAVDLFDWRPRFPVCLMFGHEVEGLPPNLSGLADTHIRIPMLGVKHSLNVATAGGVLLFELLRRFRELHS